MKSIELSTYRHEFGSLLDLEDNDELLDLNQDQKDLVLHLIAAHHGRGRPHFPPDEAFDHEPRKRTWVRSPPRCHNASLDFRGSTAAGDWPISNRSCVPPTTQRVPIHRQLWRTQSDQPQAQHLRQRRSNQP